MKDRYKRQSFLGEASDAVYGACVAGVIGLGGGGSHLVQQSAHLGVGNFLLIDPDKVEESNLNRLVGATFRDVKRGTLKTSVARRLIRNINPSARIETESKKWQDCHRLLRGCDVLFGCLDTYRDRSELEATARRYLIPYIDIGMDVHTIGDEFAVSGQVILSMPGEPCMRCTGFLREELLAKEAANYGAAGDRPQVIWANGALASAAMGVFTSLFTPWSRACKTSIYLEYDGNSQTVTPSRRLEFMTGKKCNHFGDAGKLGDPFWVPSRSIGRAPKVSSMSARKSSS